MDSSSEVPKLRVMLIAQAPLHGDAPLARVAAAFRAAGHSSLLAGPMAQPLPGDPDSLLPLRAGGSPLALLWNAWRVAQRARHWQPELYLAAGAYAATWAHSGRGATGGYGLSVFWLARWEGDDPQRLARWLARRALHECDRWVMAEPTLAARLVAEAGGRGGDLTLLPHGTPEAWVPLCERFFQEPPGFGWRALP